MAVEANKNNDEAAIQGLLDDRIRSLHDKNIEGIMSLYAQEVVSFDIVPPLQYIGADAFRKVWEEIFFIFQGPINYEIHDLSITVGDDVAFTHSFNRLSATLTTGQKLGPWVRWTACFRKINGKWLIVHHQVSVPVDLETGKALLDLKP
jgi:ketosteroid isomerase-like protein